MCSKWHTNQSNGILPPQKDDLNFKGRMRNLLDMLNGIRLAAIIQKEKKLKIEYVLETATIEQEKLLTTLGIEDFHKTRPQIKGVGVYN